MDGLVSLAGVVELKAAAWGTLGLVYSSSRTEF